MAGFHKMVSMARTPVEKEEEVEEMASPIAHVPDVPYGLCISLSEVELEKLGLPDDPEVGDMLHLVGMATVTSVSKHDHGSGPSCRVELCLGHMAVESEDDEDVPDEKPKRKKAA